MPLSWNEIKQNAIRFARDWAGESREDAEAKSFWDAFFEVFGVRRRTVATFEEPVRNLKGQYGYIDLFWRGKLLVEHKSRGKDLDRASSQAFAYLQALAADGRQDEIPRCVIVSDFARIALHDLEPEEQLDLPLFEGRRVNTIEFPLADLHRHVHAFAFIAGYKPHRVDPEDPANIRAAEVMGQLHDALAAGGYQGHALERFLVRILFCLFAEDSGIFDPNAFTNCLENSTREDGSDLGLHLARFFLLLNAPQDRRQAGLDERLASLPYVNGGLFAETLPFAEFNRDMRLALVRCTRFDWSRISPAVFGSLFQSVMEPAARRQVGAHYTSERDILKVIRSLFLDDLRAEFARIRTSKPKLEAFHQKLAALRFLDPACGCGNFLVLTYRELRLLEMDVLEALRIHEQIIPGADISAISCIDVDQFYGIEIEEFPALIAETALWLMDHQMNLRLSERMGRYYQRLPLKKSATIHVGNALRLDWKELLPPENCAYILGNPPFVGAKFQTPEQKADIAAVAGGVNNAGLLDYVTGWYFKAADYIQGTCIAAGFVSTNSISQGEQPGVLWNPLFAKGMKIRFAHRTFPWASEARGKAHVHVVIIGFGGADSATKRIYDYEGETPTVREVRNISPYLVEGPDTAIVNRQKPLCAVPEIGIGNKPIDGGNYLFTAAEKDAFLKLQPEAAPYFRPWIGSAEFINGWQRWCLWLGDCPPGELRKMPEVMKRIEAVREFRLASKSPPTQKLALTPTRFHVENLPASNFLVVPGVSSERRPYIPIGFMTPDVIASNLVNIIPAATLWHFGILTSAMHMAWVKQVCGRLKSDYRYSNKLVYNNFPWPQPAPDAADKSNLSDGSVGSDRSDRSGRSDKAAAEFARRRAAVEASAQAVLDARAPHLARGSTLADLYDPLTMPPELVRAHQALDHAVEKCYRPAPFAGDRARVEHLFALYEKLTTGPLEAGMKARPRRHKNSANVFEL
ncbi:MAG: DNA methyltransferase [Lentisphaeria bacterium]|jgi:hypothetical protein